MLRLTLLAACLLAAIQISNVNGIGPFRERSVTLTIPPVYQHAPLKETFLIKKGHRRLKLLDKDLPKCEIRRAMVNVDVIGHMNFVDIFIAEDLNSVGLKRKRARKDTEVLAQPT